MSRQPAQDNPSSESNATDPRESKLRKLKMLEEGGVNPYPPKFERTHLAACLQATYESLENGAETEDNVAVAGRIRAMRNNGMFIDLHDASGKIQVFCHADNMSAEELEKLKTMDLGDIIGAHGTIRRTPRGELSVKVTDVVMLTKSLLPLPEKYHGLSDIEQRYRQRYLDLIMNEHAKKTLRTRSKIITAIRKYMDGMGAVEVETPILHPIMGGATAKPFTTHHNALDTDFYLRVAPELYLKRLIVGGFADAVYEIGRNFRNEGISVRHNPEFTMIEAYHTGFDYNDVMDTVEALVCAIVQDVHGSLKVPYGDYEVDFTGPWPRKSMATLVAEATDIDFLRFETAEEARRAAEDLGVKTEPHMNWGQVLETVFEAQVEPGLIQPIHVTDHPLDISPLAKVHRDNPRLTERFETFINHWEIGNGYSELNDPQEQRRRFEQQVAAAEAGDEEAQMLDEDFISALEYGLPPTGGWGIGVDRFVMLLTGSSNIRDVICFPTLRPKE
ncbi:MAG: lysine--tRNA ligase [Alphaproteobacteria bacterium]|nr:lysine--tRNA ligase [Alphaproteobacteria bacterium]